jgi:prepilin-type N-terminal cleavage/methylation domain-containing protein
MKTQELRPIRSAARHRRADAGFTLLEIMIALLLLVVGTFGLAALLPHGSKSARAGEDARASQIAATTMGRLLESPYAAPVLAPGTHDDNRNPYERIYYVSWNVDDNQPIASCKRITVTVRWPAANSNSNVRLVAVTPASR